jgi:uncharacterized protein
VTVYLDSSALVKLVIDEPESMALTRLLERRADRVSCVLARTEVVRAVLDLGAQRIEHARDTVTRLMLVALSDAILDTAAHIRPLNVRSLDAIHLAAELTLGDDLEAIVTYDGRMTEGARALGLRVEAPA